MRYIGIDYGTKKVGIALSDEEGRVAFPHGVLPNDADLLAEIASLVRGRGVAAAVIGESRDFQGKENPVMRRIREFAAALERETALPISYEQEFFTSAAALRSPGGGGKPAARKVATGKREVVDASAAALLLQSHLDKKSK